MKSTWLTRGLPVLLSLLGALVVPLQAEQLLTVESVKELALQYNRTYLRAGEEVKQAESEVAVARSGALPDLSLNGYYNRNIKLPTFFLNGEDGQTISFTSGFKNDFGVSLSLRQSIWQGGRVFQAYKIAKKYKTYSLAVEQQVEDEVMVSAEELYYNALLTKSYLTVLEKSYAARSENLEVVNKLYSQGMVSEFDQLRAKVEKANLEPMILEAESNVRLAEKQLKSFIGMELNEPILLKEPPYDTGIVIPDKDRLIQLALKNRPEIHQATTLTDITSRAISVAKADYLPTLEAVSTYGWAAQSDDFTLAKNNTRTWSAGIQLSVPIFNGGETGGNVKNYRAEYNKAKLALMETKDQIRLEVEAAYDKLMQAKNSLAIQRTTIAQAEEGLNIASLRYESGVGTQLEVLAAEASLTEARNSFETAKFNYRIALASLRKATTIDITKPGSVENE